VTKLKGLAIAFAAAAAALPATSANAAVVAVVIDGSAGSFSNPAVNCAGTTAPCSFTDTATFVTPLGFNSVSGILNSTFNTSNPATNLNFTSVVLNNSASNFAFNISNGVFDSASREMIPLISGAVNTLTISGQSFGDASYSGTLSFGQTAAVPEPSTWAMMLIGFGAVGFSMRRRRRASARLMQVA
jgi:hypothetical protein